MKSGAEQGHPIARATVWDKRYAGEGYVFGTEPNGFLVAAAPLIPRGRVLCLGDGEGRNGVYLASLGHAVVSVDASAVGLRKARALAAQAGVEIETVQVDLDAFLIEPLAWDAIVSIFCHVPRVLRARLHEAIASGLRHGGVYILEAYTPDQLRHRTGGPSDPALLVRATDAECELDGLELLVCREVERAVVEGVAHTGLAAVTQVVARRPGGCCIAGLPSGLEVPTGGA